MKNTDTSKAKAARLRLLGIKTADAGSCRRGFKLRLAAAKLGDEEAQVSVGYDLAYGMLGKANPDEALLWWKRAYRQGSWAAAFNLGMFFRDGRRWTQALTWFERAVEAGDKDGLIEIAKIHLRYGGDRKSGLRYLKRAVAAKPQLTDQARLDTERIIKEQKALSPGDLIYSEADLLDERRQYAKAFALLLRGAKAGNATCQCRLADYMSYGRRGVSADPTQAIYWYKQAYKRGNTTAAHNLAIDYLRDKKVDEAYRWFERAVKGGDRSSHLRLAKIWLYERDNKPKAIEHLHTLFAGKLWEVGENDRDEARTMLRRLLLQRKPPTTHRPKPSAPRTP